MKLPGWFSPASPCGQRSSPSKPRSLPLASITCGWKSSSKSLRSVALRRFSSIISRAWARSFMSLEKKRYWRRPARLASYMAMSAERSSWSTLTPQSGKWAMPMLAPRVTSVPSILCRTEISSMSFSATRAASSG